MAKATALLHKRKNETKLANAVCVAKISLEKNRIKDEIFGRFV